jgi:hypothetical protein
MDIVNDTGRLIQFHGELRKTHPIYKSWGKISTNFVYDGRKLIQFHGKLRKTDPIYKSRGIFSAPKQRIQAIFTTVAMNLKRYFYMNDRNFTWYLQWWQNA